MTVKNGHIQFHLCSYQCNLTQFAESSSLCVLSRLIPGPWSPCSVTCGLGKQTRELKCRVLLSFTQTEVDLPEEECGEERPQLERPCDGGACTLGPGFSPDLQDPQGPHTQGEEPHHWDYRGFSGCSASCATGEMHRCFNEIQTLSQTL